MARRLNLYGFSLAEMRRLCGSRDEIALQELRTHIEIELRFWSSNEREELNRVVERAVMTGVPFPDLEAETYIHSVAAGLLAAHGQKWLITQASGYHATALEQGLWGKFRKYAGPEAKAFFCGLIEGIPLFGRQSPSDGSAYAAIGLDRLRAFQPHLRDFAEVVEYRVGQNQSATQEDRAGMAFVSEFCGSIDEIIAAGKDLWFVFG